jgi:ceramide glucosyltransferase
MIGLAAALGWICCALALCGTAISAAAAVLVRKSPAGPAPASAQPVTLLKPLHGDEPGLEANLRSFLTQTYSGPLETVFGVQNPNDSAIAVVQRVLRDYPEADAELVVDERSHGTNPKVSNLLNMMPIVRHGIIVLSDSDIRAAPDYVARVVAGLQRPGVGAVTVPYIGKPSMSVWSRLVAMGISYQFLPNVVFGTALGMAKPCFGSTIALRRTTLAAIGGFAALADHLADDYELGRAVRALGETVAVAPFAVEHWCSEQSFGQLWRHELRWLRTIGLVDPAGHIGSLITFPLAWAIIGAALLGLAPAPIAVLLAALAARTWLKTRIDAAFDAHSGPLWFVPVRDMISFGAFIGSLFKTPVDWRGQSYRVKSDGIITKRNRTGNA